MKKKMISILLCAALGITTLAGCGGASGGTTVASEPAAAVAEESQESAAPESTEASEAWTAPSKTRFRMILPLC